MVNCIGCGSWVGWGLDGMGWNGVHFACNNASCNRVRNLVKFMYNYDVITNK